MLKDTNQRDWPCASAIKIERLDLGLAEAGWGRAGRSKRVDYAGSWEACCRGECRHHVPELSWCLSEKGEWPSMCVLSRHHSDCPRVLSRPGRRSILCDLITGLPAQPLLRARRVTYAVRFQPRWVPGISPAVSPRNQLEGVAQQ